MVPHLRLVTLRGGMLPTGVVTVLPTHQGNRAGGPEPWRVVCICICVYCFCCMIPGRCPHFIGTLQTASRLIRDLCSLHHPSKLCVMLRVLLSRKPTVVAMCSTAFDFDVSSRL
jgi:hypothetical protein